MLTKLGYKLVNAAKEGVSVHDAAMKEPPPRQFSSDRLLHSSFELVRAGNNDTGINIGSRSGEIVKHPHVAGLRHAIHIEITCCLKVYHHTSPIGNVNIHAARSGRIVFDRHQPVGVRRMNIDLYP